MSHLISRRSQGQKGFTLVEIMIAMVLGLLLVGGVVQVFGAVRQTNRVHENTARMQESGRMALEIMGRDIRMADFWGCAASVSNVVNNLNNANAGYIDFSKGIDGQEGAAGAPDTLILRGGFDTGLNVEPPFGPQASADVKVAAGNTLAQGDIIFVSDCSSADIFQISNANPAGSGQLVHNTGATTSPGNFNLSNPGCPGGGNAHCLSKVYGADATVFGARQITYTIGMGSEGEPALFRNGEELLDGVEDLQVLYGEDTNGTGVANYYVPADQVADMERVVSIRFAVVTRSYSANLTGGQNQTYTVLGTDRIAADTRLRQVYSSTVAVRNRL